MNTYDRNPPGSVELIVKNWGTERWFVNTEKYCGKELFVAKGRCFSYHYHRVKEETFFIKSGCCELIISKPFKFDILKASPNDAKLNYTYLPAKYQVIPRHNTESFLLKAYDKFHILPYRAHLVRAVEDTYIIEFSTSHYDEDSIRIIPS